jgi:hypothetical protein
MTASCRAVVFLVFLIGALPLCATTWFVRPDGGTRYSPKLLAGQCDGKADVAYPGKGVNRHCAFNDVRYMWMDSSYGNSRWVMAGGDTLVIRGCAASRSQQNPDAPHCRIGWDKATGNDAENFWCAGVDAWWGCSMPPLPSGTASEHTRILGGCAYGTYSCNPVIGYPYTNNNLTQLFAGFASGALMYLSGSSYVDVEGLEITTHNGQCTRVGAPAYPKSCSTDRPVSDYGQWGIITNDKTSNITMQDLYIHGFTNIGVGGAIGGAMTLTRVSIDFNAFAGWNFDDGHSTHDAPGSSITQNYVTMVGNGCLEEYPIKHPQFPALACWDSNSGGFGDAWSGQDSKLDSFTCDHCELRYNVKDAAMGPHTVIHSIAVTNSLFAGNAGQAGKWGQAANSGFLFQNNIILGDCLALQTQIPGARQASFGQKSGLPGAYVTGCRAAGGLFAYFASSGANVNFNNNTIVTYQPTILQFGCTPPNTHACANTAYNVTNNIILGYTTSEYSDTPSLYYFDEPSAHVAASHNIEYGIRSGDSCGRNGNLCSDPELVNQPKQRRIGDIFPANLDFHPSGGSPANGKGKPIDGVSSDYYGRQRPNPPSIGAVEPIH